MLVQHASNWSFHQLLEDGRLREVCTHGYEKVRSVTEIVAMMRIMAASAHERGNDMQLQVASLDLKQAFARVTPRQLYDAMVESATQPALAMSLLREQVRGRTTVGRVVHHDRCQLQNSKSARDAWLGSLLSDEANRMSAMDRAATAQKMVVLRSPVFLSGGGAFPTSPLWEVLRSHPLVVLPSSSHFEWCCFTLWSGVACSLFGVLLLSPSPPSLDWCCILPLSPPPPPPPLPPPPTTTLFLRWCNMCSLLGEGH